jgi:hypothetical protein
MKKIIRMLPVALFLVALQTANLDAQTDKTNKKNKQTDSTYRTQPNPNRRDSVKDWYKPDSPGMRHDSMGKHKNMR